MNENNFTSRVWCALMQEIATHAEEMAGEKKMACCVRSYHEYKDIWAASNLGPRQLPIMKRGEGLVSMT